MVLLLVLSCDSAAPAPDTGAGVGPAARPVNTTCFAPDRPASSAGLALQRRYPSVSFDGAVELQQRPGDPRRWYVVEQRGLVWTFDATDDATDERVLFLDITDRVDDSYNESGLIGMAFHADFATNGEFFLSYTAPGQGGAAFEHRISRFTSPDRDVDGDETSEEVLLAYDQPYANHDGGSIRWGPDGLLYVGTGDGGSAGDPLESGQDTHSLLGKVLRVDPDGVEPYAIPADNPFADGAEGAPEVYAWGLRNPWRMNFDSATGELWLGDVGQDEIEEVDRVELGGNYGWNEKEGSSCYEAPAPCDGGGYIDPVAEYGHEEGRSVVGGVVYRGSTIPSLVGTYLYADFYTGNLWALRYDDAGLAVPELVLASGFYTASFASDDAGEVYVLDYLGGIYRLVASDQAADSAFPEQLSQTGCFADGQPVDALVAYDVNVALWSDGATKDRWFALPDDTQVTIGTDGDLEFPPRSVLVKTFSVGGVRAETRLLVRHEDGNWAGYTFAWAPDQSDADWVPAGGSVDVGDAAWTLPSSSACSQCHTVAAGRSLGLELAQLHRDGQLERLAEMGLFASDVPSVDPLPAIDGGASLQARARAYLHVNCGNCHRPDGPGRGNLDLRFSADEVGGCDADPTEGDLGVAGVEVIDPGNPANSVVSLRMHALDANRMPPLASSVVDTEGVALVDAWISAMEACP